MARVAAGELETLSDGRFAARITIEGRNRKSFLLVHLATEPEARERCQAMAGIAARLRKADLASQTLPTMTMAAVARPGRSWENVLGAVDALLSGSTQEERSKVVPTFAAFAEDWTSGRLHAKHPDHVRTKDAGNDVARLKTSLIADHLGQMRLDEITHLRRRPRHVEPP